MNEHEQETAEWLATLYQQYEWNGVIHEVDAVLLEARAAREQTHRYRETLWTTAQLLTQLADETGNEKLLDAARDIKRLMQWSETNTQPVQLDLFPMPHVEGGAL